jgi:hypothetical protein
MKEPPPVLVFWKKNAKLKEPLVHALARLKEMPEPNFHERSVK